MVKKALESKANRELIDKLRREGRAYQRMKEIKGPHEFVKYLCSVENEQNDSENPFNCPNLVVLPEDVGYTFSRYEGTTFEKGTLICKATIHSDVERCNVNSNLKVDESGSLEFKCGLGSEFKVKLESFKSK